MSNKTLLDDEAFLMACEMGCVFWTFYPKTTRLLVGGIDCGQQYLRLRSVGKVTTRYKPKTNKHQVVVIG